LLETYFAAEKKDEFLALAKDFKEKSASSNDILWAKVVSMGQELSPGNALFAGESSGIKAADFVPSKPLSTDIDVGESEASAQPDFDVGEDLSEIDNFDISDPIVAVESNEETFDDVDTGSFEAEVDSIDNFDSSLSLDIDSSPIELSDEATEAIDIEGVEDEINDLSIDMSPDSTMAIGVDDEIESNDLTGDLTSALDAVSLDDDMLDIDEADLSFDGGLSASGDDSLADLSLGLDGSLAADASSAGDEIIADLEASTSDLTEIDFDDDGLSGVQNTSDTLGQDTIDIDNIMVDDEVETKLDLARAFIDMGDVEGAKSSLEEVIAEGTVEQIKEAKSLVSKLS